jgi:hypothetical protein
MMVYNPVVAIERQFRDCALDGLATVGRETRGAARTAVTENPIVAHMIASLNEVVDR